MPNSLGCSIYLSTFRKNHTLPSHLREGSLVFTSAHIPEENPAEYADVLKDLCKAAHDKGSLVVCDVDGGTAKEFGFNSIKEFQKAMSIDILRLDDGFDHDDLLELAKEHVIACNASTAEPETIQELLKINPKTLFVHNFYPRPETGLDQETFTEMNQQIPKENLVVFIPGDKEQRGPLYEGLVTLESHRHIHPYLAYCDLRRQGIVHILTADPALSKEQGKLILDYAEGVMNIPAVGLPEDLYDRIFTIRPDTNQTLKRLSESRAYGKPGIPVKPANTTVRLAGSITQDNERYGRYAGEIMIAAKDLPADERVNVIGQIQPDYLPVKDWIDRGSKIRFIRPVPNTK